MLILVTDKKVILGEGLNNSQSYHYQIDHQHVELGLGLIREKVIHFQS